MDLEEEPFEPLDKVEVAMYNDNNAQGEMVTHLTNKVEDDISEDKIKRQLARIVSMILITKKNDLNLANSNYEELSFKEEETIGFKQIERI